MKILHVVNSRTRRGAELFAADLIGALDDQGIQQEVAVLAPGYPPFIDYAAPMTVLHSKNRRTPLASTSLALALRKKTRHMRPDVITAHGGDPLKYVVTSTPDHRPPLVYRRISSTRGYVDSRAKRTFHGIFVRRADRIVSVASVIKNQIADVFQVPLDRIVEIPRGIDPARLRAHRERQEVRADLQIPSDANVVLFLGALSWEKDPVSLVSIITGALGASPNSYGLIAGDGPLRSSVERLLASGRIRNRIFLLGSRSDVGDLLQASDVLLMTSITEGMPGALIEAGMTGLPVVSYDVGGVSEVVVDGETGLLAAPGDAAVLQGHLTHLLDDAQRRRRMGERAKTHCSSFDIHEIARRYLSVYEELA